MEALVEPEIEVRLRPPSGSGRLQPRYDVEADVLEVGSAIPRGWPFGLDVRGKVILDLDRDGKLANFDLLIPRRLWHVDSNLEVPQATRQADLQFSARTLSHKSFDTPVRVVTDEARSCAVIEFGHHSARNVDVIELSARCYAFVEAGALRGFFVRLP